MNKLGLGSVALFLCIVGTSALRAEDAPPATAPVEAAAPHVFQFQPLPEGDVLFWHGEVPPPGQAAALPSSQYWLGLVCTPVDPALRAHVNLPEDRGLLVRDVAAESPAAEAGIERFDILLSYGDAPVANLVDLISAVEASGKVETQITLVRGGEETTVNVTPVDRPADATATADVLLDRTTNLPLPPGVAPGPVQLQFVHPPTLALVGRLQAIPAGVSITIVQEDDGPATVQVTRGEESWEATADDLSALPEELRPVVRRMLGQPVPAAVAQPPVPFTVHFPGQPGAAARTFVMPAPGAPGDAVWMPRPAQVGAEPGADQAIGNAQVLERLERIEQQLEELQHSLDVEGN